MNVSWTGELREFLHIFFPGLFLMVNIVGSCYVCPITSECLTSKWLTGILGKIPGQDALAFAAVLSFGYLAGITLRLIRPDQLDRLSHRIGVIWYYSRVLHWLRLWLWPQTSTARDVYENAWFGHWSGFPFPYIEWIGWLADNNYLPKRAKAFYKATWKRTVGTALNREYFNFCKSAIYHESPESAKEVQGAEALTRYMTGAFCSICISALLIATAATFRARETSIWGVALPLIVLYAVAAGVILVRLDTIRVKEALTLFAACCANSDAIGDLLLVSPKDETGSDPQAGVAR